MDRLTRFLENSLKLHLPQGGLLRNSVTLFTGATLGQLIPFFAGPVLARLYSPSDFGFFALMSTTAGIASLISTGSYEYAVVKAPDDDDAVDLLGLAVALSLFFSFISALIIFSILLFVDPWVNNPFGWVWMLVPLFVFFQGLMNVLNFRLNRQMNYRCMAKGKMLRDSAMTFSQLVFGFLHVRWGLLPGVMVGQTAANCFFVSRLKSVFFAAIRELSFKRLRNTFIKYYRYPLYLMPAHIINELSIHVPIYCLNIFFSNSAVGLYALPQKFLNVPVVLIGNSIGQVFFKDAVRQLHTPDELKRTTLSLFSMLFYVGVIPFSTVMVFGDSIITWFFGAEWYLSGVYAQYLSPWLMFVLIGSPISRLFTVLDQQNKSLWFNIVLLCIRTGGLFVGVFVFNSADVAVKLFAVSGALYWIFLSFYILRMVHVELIPVAVNIFVTWFLVLSILVAIRCAM
ncbi:MAG: oligosaccharide flippase family protein [Bacteroidales bacterium]|nr:oligosaccharide flippase family protein [Bacteroidales bacterium]